MKKLLPAFAVLLFAQITFSQTAQITGTVRDAETNEPLNGASIKYDKTRGAITDASGKFKLTIPVGEHELAVVFMGYKTDKRVVTLTEGEVLNLEIAMKPTAIQISQVVTVSQYRKNSAKETVTTEVINKNQIKNTNSNDIGEIVSKTPGVLVQDGQISIRGGSSYSYGVGSRTAVLSDGLSLMSADLQEGQSKMAAVENVKQVEVIKGASSVVYGSSALNGVVNVVTEWPQDNDPKTELELNFGIYDNPHSANIKKWWGSRVNPAFGNINFNHQRRIKQLQLVVAGNLTRNEGYLDLNDEFRIRAVFKTRYLHPKIEGLNFGVNGLVMHEMSERFFISQDLDSLALFRAAGSTDQYTRTTIDPHLSYHNSKGHRFTSNLRYMNIFREGGDIQDAVSHSVIMDNQYQYKWKNMLVLTAGVPFTVGKSISNLYPEWRLNYNVAVYSQLEFNYKVLTLQGGIRYEVSAVDTFIESTRPVFRSGLNVQAGKATFFRASFGQAYRIASIGEKFIASEFTGGLVIVPNDTLKSERGWSVELGFKQGFKIGNWSAYFDAAFYWQQYTNFIEYQLGIWPNTYSNGGAIFPDSLEYPAGSGNLFGLKAFNVEQARIAGYEIGLAGNGKIGPVGIQLLTGYTYSWPGRIDSDTGSSHYTTGEFFKDIFKYNFKKVPGDEANKLLNYRMRHLFRADIELTYWKCYLGTTLNYNSTPEKVPTLFRAASLIFFGDINALDRYLAEHKKGEFYLDMRAGIKVNDHFKVGFIIKNLTNRMYQLRPGKPEPLRNFTLQLRYTF